MKTLISLILIVAVVFSGCSPINQKANLDDDNPIEEAGEIILNESGEALIKYFTGQDVELDFDFTPGSKEKR